MSVIFFEGFDRQLDENYWQLVTATRDDSCLKFTPSNTYASVAKLTIPPISFQFKKLYLGVRLSNYGVNIVAQSGGVISQPLLKFVNRATNDVYFEIRWRFIPASSQIVLSVRRPPNTESARFLLQTANPQTGLEQLHSYLSDSTYSYLFAPSNGEWPTTPCASTISRVIEFEIDSAAQKIAVRFEGMPLFDLTSSSYLGNLNVSSSALLTGLDIHGSQTCESKLHDIYLIDSTGLYANTWLGHDFEVMPVYFKTTEPAVLNNWVEVSSDQNIINGDIINENDGDIAYIAANDTEQNQAYKLLLGSPVAGSVAGIRANNVVKKTGDEHFWYKYIAHNISSNVTTEMGNIMRSPATNAYTMQLTQFINEDPQTNQQWNFTAIQNLRAFGVKSKPAP